MSIQRCEYCDINIDTDYDAEHFNTENNDCECITQEQDVEQQFIKQLKAPFDYDQEKENIKNIGADL